MLPVASSSARRFLLFVCFDQFLFSQFPFFILLFTLLPCPSLFPASYTHTPTHTALMIGELLFFWTVFLYAVSPPIDGAVNHD